MLLITNPAVPPSDALVLSSRTHRNVLESLDRLADGVFDLDCVDDISKCDSPIRVDEWLGSASG